jgi:hypothetical protein
LERKLLLILFQKEILLSFFGEKTIVKSFPKRDSFFPSLERKLLLILFQKEILLSFFGEKTIVNSFPKRDSTFLLWRENYWGDTTLRHLLLHLIRLSPAGTHGSIWVSIVPPTLQNMLLKYFYFFTKVKP